MSTEDNRVAKSARARLVGLLAASLVVASYPLLSTLKLAAMNEEYTHILLILPISVAFICAEWTSVQSGPAIAHGLVLLSAAGVIGAFSCLHLAWISADLRLSIEMLALVTWWIGSFVFCFGTKVSRAMLFPLCFLFWMVPLPSLALSEIIRYLQQGSAISARFLFTAAGVPVSQDGVMLTIPGLTVEIAKECSSIRSSLLLLITTMVIAKIFLRSPVTKTLVIVIAVPLSVAKNGLRIFTLAMLATRVDPEFLTGKLHHQGGVVFFVISLLFMLLLIGLLRRGEDLTEAKRAMGAPVC